VLGLWEYFWSWVAPPPPVGKKVIIQKIDVILEVVVDSISLSKRVAFFQCTGSPKVTIGAITTL